MSRETPPVLRTSRGIYPVRRPSCGARRLSWALSALAASLLAACTAPSEVLVGAAASLSGALEPAIAEFGLERPEARVRLVLGASSALAEQMRAGAPLDLLVAADPRVVDGLAAAGVVGPAGRARVAGNRLVVLVRRGLAGAPASADGLLDARIRRLAVPDAAVPVGGYARDWLAARGLFRPLESRLVATADARATLAAVDAGEVDAAIVYATDARIARSAVVAFPIPAAEHPEIAYEAALRSDAGDEARAFFAFLAAGGAARGLEAAGFLAPPGAP